jgi:hypothetical protein
MKKQWVFFIVCLIVLVLGSAATGLIEDSPKSGRPTTSTGNSAMDSAMKGMGQ